MKAEVYEEPKAVVVDFENDYVFTAGSAAANPSVVGSGTANG